jgi:hypothetical protein
MAALLDFTTTIVETYVVSTWTLRVVDKKQLESSQMWCWRRAEGLGELKVKGRGVMFYSAVNML